MSSEARVVRPYAGVGEVQGALSTVKTWIGGEAVSPGGHRSVPTRSFVSEQVHLELAPEDEFEKFCSGLRGGVESAGVPTDSVELVALLTSPRLRLAEVAWRKAIDGLTSDHRTIRLATAERRPSPLLAVHGGCIITLYVILTEELSPKPLRPHRTGTWLGRVNFRIVTDLGEVGFTPIPLDEGQRTRLGLSANTLRYVEVEQECVLDPDLASDSARLYVDEQILGELSRSPHTPGAKTFQRQLYLDFLRAVVHTGSYEMSKADSIPRFDEVEDSLLGRLLSRSLSLMGIDHRDQRQEWLTQVVRNPELVVANLESVIERFRKDISAAIAEEIR